MKQVGLGPPLEGDSPWAAFLQEDGPQAQAASC